MVVVAKLKAKQGSEASLEQAFRALLTPVADEEGTLAYILHRSQKDPTVFLIYEKYKDSKALTAHSSTPHFKEFFAASKSLLAEAPVIEMFDEIGAISRD